MDSTLEQLAALFGIEPGYHDAWGQWRTCSDETLRALLQAMGVDARTPEAAIAASRDFDRDAWGRVVPAISVLRAADLARGVRLRLRDAPQPRSLAWRIVDESGKQREERFDALDLAVLEEREIDGVLVRALALPLPPELPEGYHRIAIVDAGAILGSGTVAVAPPRCYLPPALAGGARLWGTAIQLYSLRSERNAGIGDFTDLRAAASTWGEAGAGIIGTNPLHALSLRDPGHSSPYSPSSRLFLNPLYIDIEAVPDFDEIASHDPHFRERWQAQCEPLRRSPGVAYERVAAAKRAMFDVLHDHFHEHHLAKATPRARAFSRFREMHGPALRSHALHEALAEFHQGPWRAWPGEFREPRGEAARRFAVDHPGRVGLHEYLQWQADLQLAAAQERCRGLGMPVGVYADLAISIGSDGSEAWANQGLYALGVHVGAPPDELNRTGQDWGLPPLAPRRLKESAHEPLVATLRANMARAGALRIDHVMGLSRLWWVPAGMKPEQGAYVRYPVDELLGIVALESHRNRCMVIGEDLGTVSDDLRAKLAEAQILSYRLLLFERDGPRFKPASEYPRAALVAWSTHDLPTFTGWWQEEDLRTLASLGLLDGEQLRARREERRIARAALVEALVREGLVDAATLSDGPAAEVLADAVHTFLARTPSSVMIVQMEDLLGVAEQANLPGTVEEHPNWRRKLPLPVEAWELDERFRRVTRQIGALRDGRRDGPAGS